MLIGISLAWTLHNSRKSFDGRRGPTGSIPTQRTGPALPVFGVENVGSVYLGAAIDWVILKAYNR
jgi:hypothetical protein